MRHDLFGAEIAERDHAAALRHHLLGAVRDGGEGIAGDIHRHAEVFRRGVHIAALELFPVGERHCVYEKIEPVPFARELRECSVDRALLRDVAIDDRGGFERLDQGRDTLPERLALVGESKLRAGNVQRLCDAPGDGAVVRDPHDEPALASHQSLGRHAGPLKLVPARGLPQSLPNARETGPGEWPEIRAVAFMDALGNQPCLSNLHASSCCLALSADSRGFPASFDGVCFRPPG